MDSQSVVSEIFRRFFCDIQDVIAHPLSTATLLFQEGVISHEVVGDVEASNKALSEKNAAIMRAVRAAVRADSSRLWVLIAVLEKFAESAPVACRMRDELVSHGLEGE